MPYDDERVKISRTPCQYVRITIRECANTFGVAPCMGSGFSCANTYPTCRDKANYNLSWRYYHFTSNNAPLPMMIGELALCEADSTIAYRDKG